MNGADGGTEGCGVKERNCCTLDGIHRLKCVEGGAEGCEPEGLAWGVVAMASEIGAYKR